ncbi:MAG TPA: hypothetical protein VJC16_00710 [Candidatus Nanoarchaeia archaeon]|nr:hypothetical protein [Candidatus Nanoarchaeia archaeon]
MYSITKDGKPLDQGMYVIDPVAETFSSVESGLVLDFSGEFGWAFNTSSDCTFDTGSGCTFKTGPDCTFNTSSDCTFDTGYGCTFKTGSGCTFNTGFDCTFKTGFDCTFDVGEKCVCIRRDVFEVIQLPPGKRIRLNGHQVHGWVEVLE